MLGEFKQFVLRGNVLDLAVGVVLGVAFNAVVQAFTDGVLMAAVAALFGEPNFDAIVWGLGDGELRVGALLTALVNLLLVGLALFAVVKAVNALRDRADREESAEPAAKPAPSDEAVLLTEIRDLLRDGRR
ncbi:MAG TPA: large conductance mechanosensitive channel protein MscL [Egibacteraceae bacterium]|nr:large conductance mechanosensitive channel protein MscL [Egibacteraceae bacterium]